MQKRHSDGIHVRIDPILVNRFKRLPAGVNEAGIKIVRDFGLRYTYDKRTDAFDIIGDDAEILHLAIETLRFWVEEDEYPSSGITCQVGYPNKSIVIWRFHGDYAKKFNHLFSEDIAQLKRVPSLYVKAVPTKRNPEYVEVFCNFMVYQQVKGVIQRISAEMGKIFQTDVFVPRSDFNKARNFARSKARDEKVLYALKEYPENNKIRVWFFSRENQELIRAKKEWTQHVGMIARDNKLVEEEKIYGVDMNTAVYIGHPSSAITSERSSPRATQKLDTINNYFKQNDANPNRQPMTDISKTSPRGPKYDNVNFPRPHNFVYPITWDETDKEFYKYSGEREHDNNPFNLDKMDDLNTADETGSRSINQNVLAVNPMAGHARWVREDEIVKTGRRVPNKPGAKKIYVHLQVDAKSSNQNFGQKTGNAVKVFHQDKNLIPSFKLNAKNVITSVTDAALAPGVKRRGKNVRPGGKKVGQARIEGSTRTLLKPVLQDQMPVSNIRYQIKVNGLSIYMYKHFVVKLDSMDALVNAVSTSLKSGGMVAKSMFDNAGESVVDEVDIYLKMYGPLKIGQNIVTSAGQIPAMGIIHVAAPVWQVYVNISEEECVRDLHKAIYDALKTAERHQYRKVGLPVISSEPYFGVPRQVVADVYVKALVDYSLAMGPLYPVLEIHVVDMDVDMLNSIKESYEKWAASPAFANMKTEFSTREHSLSSPTQLSKRAESAVNLKSARSHKSQNMVTFMAQSYTSEGNQVWTFEVLGKLLVHVYTGSLLNVECVDGLVCGVDTHMKGTLAKQFFIHGGPAYEWALKKARGKMDLDEGDVIVSDAGSLNADLVLHSIVANPIYRVSRKNLARLDNINNEVLHTANQMDIQRLALPLIGTARLREAFEVEQCSLQLVDNIIEFSLSMENNLRIKELHLVNVNSATTQSLTQALRTRAHTKLRVEVARHSPSRQEVLSTADTFKQMSDMHMQTHGFQNEDIVGEHPENIIPARKDMEADAEGKIDSTSRNVHVRARRKVRYLSEKNLKEHEKTMRDQDRERSEEKVASIGIAISNDIDKAGQEKSENLNRVKPLSQIARVKPVSQIAMTKPKPILPKRELPMVQQYTEERTIAPPNLPKLDLGEFQKSNEAMKTIRQKQRTPIKGPIMLRSRAESYREIYERRKSNVAKRRNEYARLRRAHSTDNAMFSKENADKVYEMFKTERNKLRTLRAANNRMEDTDMGSLVDKYSNFFTRGTRERYRINAGHNIDDKNFEMTYKLDPEITINDMIPRQQQGDMNGVTERDTKEIEHPDRNMNRRFKMADRKKDREELYMMNMAYGLPEANVQVDPEQREGIAQSPPALDQMGVPLTDRSALSRKRRQDRFENITGATQHLNDTREDENNGIHDIEDGSEPPAHLSGNGNQPSGQYSNETADEYRDEEIPEISEQNSKIMEQFDQYVSETNYHNKDHIDAIAAAFDQYVADPDPNLNQTNGKKTAAKSAKHPTLKTGKRARETLKPIKDQIVKRKNANNSNIGRLKKTPIDSKPTPREVILSNAEHFPTNTNLDQGVLNPNEIYPEIPRAPRPEDVTIRDKLKVEIDVMNKADLESSKVKKEKKKIKRFWEVVDDSKELEDNNIYGDENEKVVVAKVTKERKMSAKSKASKSNTSTVTQPIGKYNVTVEVA